MLELIRKINHQKINENETGDIIKRFEKSKINVSDLHYGSNFGSRYEARLILIKEVEKGFSVAVIDVVGGIYLLDIEDNKFILNNNIGFGTVIGDKVESWCFDREGTVAYGYESTYKYAEKAY